MYRVVLADDEPWNLQGLAQMIDWEAAGFTVVFSTVKPMTALEYVIENDPDVLFTDIRMPGCTGTELVRQLRSRGYDTECVIISGFSEFGYAQEAIRGGVVEYCLKPLKAAELLALLEKLSQRLARKEKSRSGGLELLFEQPELFTAAVRKAAPNAENNARFGLMIASDRDFNASPESGGFLLKYRLGGGRFVYAADEATLNRARLACAKKTLESAAGISAVHGLTERDGLPVAYNEARIAETTAFICGSGRCYEYRPGNIPVINKMVETMTGMTARGQGDQLERYVRDLPGSFLRQGLNIRDLEILWNRLVSFALENYADSPANGSFDFLIFEEIADQFEDYDEFGQYMLSQMLSLTDAPAAAKDMDHAQFSKLIQYIDEHYNENLLLKDLAKRFYFNANYCCLLFKKYVNVPFSEYLNELRINEAKRILREGNRSAGEIAGMVGYSDYFYFSKVFKKVTGMTLKTYRLSSRGA